MGNKNYWIAMKKLENYRKSWLKVNPTLPESAGIYILTRVDENGFKYAYIGQAKKILTRLAQHLTQYEHIDLSLKKHKLYSEKNPYGWQVDYCMTLESELDEYEQKFIKEFANKGYQLRNKTSGGQGVGKSGISDEQTTKGYRDGLKQGYKNCLKDIKEYFDKYFVIVMKGNYRKKDGSVKELWLKKAKEISDLLEGDFDDTETNNS